jgi:phytoene desaturase
VSARAIVIGGGVAGLASAALLARDGFEVELLEKNGTLGGRAGTWQEGGFHFDTGPSWYLMPQVFEHFYRLLGTSADEQLDLVPLKPAYRVFFEDGTAPLDVTSDRAQVVETFERLQPGAGAGLERYLDSAETAYELARRRFLYTTYQSLTTLLTPDVLRHAPRLLRLLVQPLDRFVAGHVQDPRLAQVLGYPAVFLGTSPDRAPSIYHLMSHLDLTDGVLYPRGGFGTVVDSLRRLAEQAGVTISTGAEVTQILTAPTLPDVRRRRRRHRAHVRGVLVSGADGERELTADVVVGAADLHHVENALLPTELRSYPEKWWSRRDPGPGAVLVMLGVRGALPQLAHHSLLFTKDWLRSFEAVRGLGALPHPTSLYVCRPSATDDFVAPPGHENLFVLVPVPADPGWGHGGVDGTGDRRVEAVADAALDQVSAWADVPDLRDRVVVRRTVGPADFVDDVHAWSGGALGPAHTLRQSAFFRARNMSSAVSGLLYAGHGTIPGIGLPMCLISAELALKAVRGDTSTGPLPEPLRPRWRQPRRRSWLSRAA